MVGVKMTSVKYVEFLTYHFLLWYKKNGSFCIKIIFFCKTTHHPMLQKIPLWQLWAEKEKNSWCGHYHYLTSTLLRTCEAS